MGISSPAHARELFEMAELVSGIGRFVELGYFNAPVNVQALYAAPSQLRHDVQRIIDLWEMATGSTLKGPAVRVVGQGGAPVRIGAPPRPRSISPHHELARRGPESARTGHERTPSGPEPSGRSRGREPSGR